MLASLKDSKSSLKLSHDDSRAQAKRSHQALKEESSSWIEFGSSQDGEEDFQEKTFERRLESYICKV